jgi:Glycosyltransferase family 87
MHLPPSSSLEPAAGPAFNAGPIRFLIPVPAILVVFIGLTSVNFKNTPIDFVREHPVGSDFLQEYVGGKIWSDQQQRKHLYDQELFREVQHDPRVTSFRWREDRYFPPVYPPWWYAITSPLSQLPYMAAARIWLAVMGASLIAALFALSYGFRVHPVLLSAVCLSPPVLLSLATGQKGTLWLMVISASLALLYNGRKSLSGAVFSLMVLKPHLGLPVGIVMLACGQWRWVTSCAGGVLAIIAATARYEPGLLTDFVSVCARMGNYAQTDGYNLADGFSVWSGMSLLVAEPRLASALSIAFSTAIMVMGIQSIRHTLNSRDEVQMAHEPFLRAMAGLVLITVTVSPHLYSYDLTLLILPAALLWKAGETGSHGNHYQLVTGLLLLVLFGKGLCVTVAEATGIPAGPILLVIACGLTLRQLRTGRTADCPSPTQRTRPVPAASL